MVSERGPCHTIWPMPERATDIHTIATPTTGRYLVSPAAGGSARGLLVGFHGYMEHAERHLRQLRAIPGSDRWHLVSVQGLNRFYDPEHRAVVAGWMTRQDREMAIADNLAYVGAVVDAVTHRTGVSGLLVYAGFSQGVAMAYRAAIGGPHRGDGIIAVAGDVPPELQMDAAVRWPPILIARGRGDEWYTDEKLQTDLRFLATRGGRVESLVFDGGHEWTEDTRTGAGHFLEALG